MQSITLIVSVTTRVSRSSLVSNHAKSLEFAFTTREQGGERLGGETSGSERKGVMQWTGSELKSETKRKQDAAKFEDLMKVKEEHCCCL